MVGDLEACTPLDFDSLATDIFCNNTDLVATGGVIATIIQNGCNMWRILQQEMLCGKIS
jgi:hypothetical protein